MQLLECVPNVSEGQNEAVIQELATTIQSIKGVNLLHVDSGFAANRTVFTFTGNAESIFEAAFQLYVKSMELIDMSIQKGTHPRQGIVDICPFIPLKGISIAEVAALTERFAQRIGKELGIPVFLYEENAKAEKRKNLAYLRKGEYESLPKKLNTLPLDYGKVENWERNGVTTIGVRKLLIAYNVNLDTKDVSIARDIAEMVRESGKVVIDSYGERERIPGRFKSVKGLGWYIKDFDCVQVSYNLTDIEQAGMLDVFLATKEEAERLGCKVTGSELVGLAPLSELLKSGQYFKAGIPSNEKGFIQSAIQCMGLNEFKPFKIEEKIIDYFL